MTVNKTNNPNSHHHSSIHSSYLYQRRLHQGSSFRALHLLSQASTSLPTSLIYLKPKPGILSISFSFISFSFIFLTTTFVSTQYISNSIYLSISIYSNKNNYLYFISFYFILFLSSFLFYLSF